MSSGMEFRRLALEMLCDASGKFKKDILRKKFEKSEIPATEKKFISEIVYGITRRRLTLEYICAQYCKKIPGDILVLNALCMGLYQMLFMQSIPAYAAINTTVDLLKERNRKKEAGYVNAILRRLQRESHEIEAKKEGADILPISSTRSLQFHSAFFPDPENKICEYWSIVYSYPLWIVERWFHRWGKQDCQALLESGNLVSPVFLRIRKNQHNIEDAFLKQGIAFSAQENLWRLEHPGRIESLPFYEEGDWAIMGTASASFVKAMNPQPGMKILDMCAAPGSKSAYIADCIGDQGTVLAIDISPDRVHTMQENKARLKIQSIHPVLMDACQLPEEYQKSFDQVLLDAPCSNSGVLSKRAEARWRLKKENLQELCKLQRKLLDSASKVVKYGGTIVYCTCSLEPEENEILIQDFLQDNQEFVCEEKKQILPLPPDLDGGSFFKLLRKSQ